MTDSLRQGALRRHGARGPHLQAAVDGFQDVFQGAPQLQVTKRSQGQTPVDARSEARQPLPALLKLRTRAPCGVPDEGVFVRTVSLHGVDRHDRQLGILGGVRAEVVIDHLLHHDVPRFFPISQS
eukprot:scaffold109_cov252-Pinguiococcus_pyrenoidosus.AAC.103